MKTAILAPVGNWEMLSTAIKSGADEVYFGIKGLNMRERAKNFDITELKKVVETCHKHNVKANLTLNTIIFDNELETVKHVLTEAKHAGIDAVICWDHAIISMCKELGLNIHLSTQASVANSEAVRFYQNMGVKRFVLARECELEHIKTIKNNTNAEIELFAHGAMCVAVSGRCFMSQFLYGNKTSANRGKCIQPCRRFYILKDPETKKELQLENHYVMSAKDMCVLPFIDKLLDLNISALKIEGRARSPEYVKVVIEAYRQAVDAYYKGTLTKELKSELVERLKTVYNRGFSNGFYLGKPVNEWTDEYGSKATKKKHYLGKVLNYFTKQRVVEVKLESNSIRKGDTVLIIGPTTGTIEQVVESMRNFDGNDIINAEKQIITFKINKKCRKNDKVFLFK